MELLIAVVGLEREGISAALAPLLPEVQQALPSAAFLINMCGLQASVTEVVANVLGKTARLASLFPGRDEALRHVMQFAR